MTQRAGLRPMEDEYVLMGMSAYGRWPSDVRRNMRDDFFTDVGNLLMKENVHAGVGDWSSNTDVREIAAATQSITEEALFAIHKLARKLTKSRNLCYGGGVALNCKFNAMLGKIWRNAWICPNPGDCGSALGAAALGYGKKLDWKDAFLGHNIPGQLDVNAVVDALLSDGMVGVANGRAEWGPRALGNRSLLADPRAHDIKHRVNEIKQRQQYRPFAPAVLSEHADVWFRIGRFDYGYMQYAVQTKLSSLMQAACHVDGTARVQVVKPDGSNLRQILEAWYARTGSPMLINTSLNIRGQPMVNDRKDADLFQDTYNVKVIS
jgi:carbamoyltransferase